jgi:hypothetical protein
MILVFSTRAEFDSFRAKLAVGGKTKNPGAAVVIGEPAYETVDKDGVPTPDSRLICAHDFTGAQADWLEAQGAEVRVGDKDGPTLAAAKAEAVAAQAESAEEAKP